MRLPPLFLLLALGTLAGCQEFTPPPTDASLRLNYPVGVTADFPHQSAGAVLEVAVLVTTSRGDPVPGAEIFWDDGYVIRAVSPERGTTDQSGMMRARWSLRPLLDGQFSRLERVRAYLPGGEGSPLEYRALMLPCTKGCEALSR